MRKILILLIMVFLFNGIFVNGQENECDYWDFIEIEGENWGKTSNCDVQWMEQNRYINIYFPINWEDAYPNVPNINESEYWGLIYKDRSKNMKYLRFYPYLEKDYPINLVPNSSTKYKFTIKSISPTDVEKYKEQLMDEKTEEEPAEDEPIKPIGKDESKTASEEELIKPTGYTISLIYIENLDLDITVELVLQVSIVASLSIYLLIFKKPKK